MYLTIRSSLHLLTITRVTQIWLLVIRALSSMCLNKTSGSSEERNETSAVITPPARDIDILCSG